MVDGCGCGCCGCGLWWLWLWLWVVVVVVVVGCGCGCGCGCGRGLWWLWLFFDIISYFYYCWKRSPSESSYKKKKEINFWNFFFPNFFFSGLFLWTTYMAQYLLKYLISHLIICNFHPNPRSIFIFFFFQIDFWIRTISLEHFLRRLANFLVSFNCNKTKKKKKKFFKKLMFEINCLVWGSGCQINKLSGTIPTQIGLLGSLNSL